MKFSNNYVPLKQDFFCKGQTLSAQGLQSTYALLFPLLCAAEV